MALDRFQRQLAKYGFVEQVKGKDHRERPWRLVATSYNWAGATAAGGIMAVTLTDAASFLTSAALLTLVRTSGRMASHEASGQSVRARLANVARELRGGLWLSARHRVLRALMIFALVTSIGEGIMSTLFTPFVEHVLHGSSQAFGFIVAAQAVGGIAGGMAAASAGQRARASRLLSCGAIAFGLVDLAIFLCPLGYVAVWPAIVVADERLRSLP